MDSWSNDTILRFIELYKNEPVIWDRKHPLNRDRIEVNAAWEKIQSSLNISIVNLKKKKESLLAHFRHVRKIIRKHPERRITWFAYNALNSFLGSKLHCDSTDELENEFFANTVTYVNKEEIDEDDPISCQNICLPGNNNNNDGKKESIQDNSSKINNKRKSDPVMEDTDECDLYTKLLAKKLKKLDEHQRDIAMHEIDNIMFRAKMKSLKSQGNVPVSTTSNIKSPVYIITQGPRNSHCEDNVIYENYDDEQPPNSA